MPRSCDDGAGWSQDAVSVAAGSQRLNRFFHFVPLLRALSHELLSLVLLSVSLPNPQLPPAPPAPPNPRCITPVTHREPAPSPKDPSFTSKFMYVHAAPSKSDVASDTLVCAALVALEEPHRHRHTRLRSRACTAQVKYVFRTGGGTRISS
jgi:hypothetical protein